jgi:hypothetical protein
MRWSQEFEIGNLTVVVLSVDKSLFNWCHSSNYNRVDVQPLLQYYNLSEGARFAVVMDIYETTVACGGSRSIKDRQYLTWSQYLVRLVQDIGGKSTSHPSLSADL